MGKPLTAREIQKALNEALNKVYGKKQDKDLDDIIAMIDKNNENLDDLRALIQKRMNEIRERHK